MNWIHSFYNIRSKSQSALSLVSFHLFKKMFCIVNKVVSLHLYRAHGNKIAYQQCFCLEIRPKLEMTDMKRYINQIKTLT